MWMRITNKMNTDLMKTNVAQAQQRYYQASRVASSGSRLQTASDDPTLASYAMNSQMEADQIEMFQSNNNTLQARLNYADTALNSIQQSIQKLNELTIASLNGTYKASDRVTMADQVVSLKQNSIQMANTQVDGHFVFSGFKTDSAPFDSSGNFVGDKNDRKVEISKDLYISGTTSGYSYFTSGAGGVDIFKLMEDMQAAMRANDLTKINTLHTDVKKALEQISLATVDVGNRINRVEMAEQALENNKLQIVQTRAGKIDADPADSYIELARYQYTYESALKVSSKTMNLSLLDFIN